jgi:hypothetical protein
VFLCMCVCICVSVCAHMCASRVRTYACAVCMAVCESVCVCVYLCVFLLACLHPARHVQALQLTIGRLPELPATAPMHQVLNKCNVNYLIPWCVSHACVVALTLLTDTPTIYKPADPSKYAEWACSFGMWSVGLRCPD